jgi:glycine cleavage system H protein
MSAGVIRYLLCSRDMDCDDCPLDAALRGAFRADDIGAAHDDSPPLGGDPPDDRVYSKGHVWMKSMTGRAGVWRVGLDGFAAALVGRPRRVRLEPCERMVSRGEAFCHMDLDVGTLILGLPVAGRLVRGNDRVDELPELVAAGASGDGWLVEVASPDPCDLRELASAEGARERAARDLRRFRRSVAFRLLSDEGLCPPAASLSGVCDLLGPTRYLEILRDFVH